MAITLTAGISANLFALQNTNTLMEQTQKRLSTGLKVDSALDDPINFFAAQEHKQRASDLNFRKDAMGEAVQTIKAANNGIEAITDLIASAKSTAQSALSTTDTTERAALATQFNSLMDQVDDLATDSGYKGINFLANDSLTVTFDAAGDNSVTVSGFTGSATGLSIADATGSWATADNINAAITDLDEAKDTLRTKSKDLANNLGVITARETFTEKMINTLNDGAAALTNADMNEEAANMLMLQTRQALGTTSLSMASQAAQAILRLF
jgi:flagellin-like hook-associated protein FlgL